MESRDSYSTSSTPALVPDHQNSNIDHTYSATQEPSHYQPSADSGALQQPVDNDILMDLDEYDAMPALQEVSDSDDSSDSDRDAYEVEMEVDSEASLPLALQGQGATLPDPSTSSAYRPSPFQATVRTNSNRRARVEDDDDDERDRRHPSQRISSSDRNAASTTSPSFIVLPEMFQNQPHVTPNARQRDALQAALTGHLGPNNHPFTFLPHLPTPDNNNTNSNNNNGPGHNHTDPAVPGDNQTPPQHPPVGNDNGRSFFGGMSFSVEIGPGFNIFGPGQDQPTQPDIPGPQNADGQPPPANTTNPPRTFVADILGMLGQLGDGLGGETIINLGNFGFGSHEKDDPERAKKLVDGLEVVPVGLVRRLERVGGIGIEAGEEPTNGGDAGCAICWDKLLDADGEGFGKEERAAIDETSKGSESLSSPPPEEAQSKIVTLPCAHVFHADCLLPWFARPKHTTCPTCRFNIDPEDLTHASMRRRRERSEPNASQANEAEGEALPTQSVDGSDGGDGLPPNVSFIPVGEFDGQGPPLFPPPNDIHDRLREVFAEYHRRRNQSTTATTNPIPTAPTSGSSNNEQTPSTAGPQSNATSEPNPPPAAPAPGMIPLRMPNISSTIIQTPHGRMGVIQVPVMFPFAFPTPMPPPGQTPSPAGAPNIPNGAAVPPVDPSAPNGHTQEIARLLRQVLRRGAPQTPQPQQAAQTTDDNIGSQSGSQNGVPETNDSANERENNSNNSGAPTDQPPPNTRQPVMEIRVDMVFGQDPFGGLFNGGNGQPGQPPFDVDEAIRNELATAHAPAAEGRQADFVARHRELEQRLVNLLEMRRRLETDLTSAGVTLPPDFQHPHPPQRGEQPTQQQPPPQAPQQPQQQPQQPQASLFNNPAIFAEGVPGPGLHFTGTGRSVSEAFAQMLGGLRPPTGQGQANLGAQPRTENQQQPGGDNDAIPPQQPAGDAPQPNRFPNLGDMFGEFMRARRRPRPYKDWILPPAPGPTLRQRVERREREAGLRCHDISCGLGPSDEDPFGVELGPGTGDMKQLSIMSKDDRSELCTHTFHGPCLVSAERVALRGADAVIEDGNVEVSCPVCRGTGCVSKKDWDEGVVSLQ